MRFSAPSLLLLAALGLAAPAAAQEVEAPFGLTWGMQIGDLSALGVEIETTSRIGNLTTVTVKNIPQSFPDTRQVSLLFDHAQGLVKVRWTGAEIGEDPTGTKGRLKYAEIRKFVVERHGDPSDERLVVGARLFDQEDEFYQCLAYEGCGVWSAIWEQKPSGGVLLSIEGAGAGKGFVQVDFESGGWQKAIAQTK